MTSLVWQFFGTQISLKTAPASLGWKRLIPVASVKRAALKGRAQRVHDEQLPNFVASEKMTPLKTNMEPQNGGLEDDFPFPLDDFQLPS